MDKFVNYLDEDGTARVIENIELKVQNVLSEVDDKIDAATSDFVTMEEAESIAIKETVQGESILIEDSAKWPLKGLKLFGKSTQDGTPSPENPVPIVSAGDSGNITVSVTGDGAEPQSLIYPNPNGLPGIPVSSGGNYTDESGQQWVCDEVDFGRGVYVKRVEKYIPQEETISVVNGALGSDSETVQVRRNTKNNPNKFTGACLFNFLSSYSSSIWRKDVECVWYGDDGYLDFRVKRSRLSEISVDGVKEFCASIGAYALYAVSPIETPLTPETLTAYAALHTNYPTTTILNDSGAGMEVGYVVDTKNYINKLLSASE